MVLLKRLSIYYLGEKSKRLFLYGFFGGVFVCVHAAPVGSPRAFPLKERPFSKYEP
jgi:hypothetical protein